MPRYIVWANELPDKEQPYWIGLPNNAERVLKQTQALDLLAKIRGTMTTDDGTCPLVIYNHGLLPLPLE